MHTPKDKGLVRTERLEAKNKIEDQTKRHASSDWPKSHNEAQESGWARFSFSFLLKSFLDYAHAKNEKKLPGKSEQQPKQAQARTETIAATAATNAS